MGGNLERNRWMIIDDADIKARIAERFAEVGRPYLADELRGAARRPQPEGDRVGRVPRRPPRRGAGAGDLAAARPSAARAVACRAARRRTTARCCPGVWSFQLAARARGIGSAWTTFHLEHEAEIAELLGIPDSVTQVCLLAVGYYTGDTFTPAPRRSAAEVTYLNRWKQPVT